MQLPKIIHQTAVYLYQTYRLYGLNCEPLFSFYNSLQNQSNRLHQQVLLHQA